MSDNKPCFETTIWDEEAHPDNPFFAEKAWCHGYDVYGDLLSKASYSDYILLLFLGEKPTVEQTRLFDILSVACGNTGPRDPAIRAAMNSGVGGSPAASNLISFLAVGAGNYEGSREVFHLVGWLHEHGTDENAWNELMQDPNRSRSPQEVWQVLEHFPGINPHSPKSSLPVQQLLNACKEADNHSLWRWFESKLASFEQQGEGGVNVNFIIALGLYRLGLTAEQAEFCHLFMRLPGAAVHALEAKHQGWKKFPFFGKQIQLSDDPGSSGELPDVSEYLK